MRIFKKIEGVNMKILKKFRVYLKIFKNFGGGQYENFKKF